MELKARYEASLTVEIPMGAHIESRLEDGRKMTYIWSTSTVSSEDAVAKISLMMRALEHALTAGGNDV